MRIPAALSIGLGAPSSTGRVPVVEDRVAAVGVHAADIDFYGPGSLVVQIDEYDRVQFSAHGSEMTSAGSGDRTPLG